MLSRYRDKRVFKYNIQTDRQKTKLDRTMYYKMKIVGLDL